jgi:hypothetical protein
LIFALRPIHPARWVGSCGGGQLTCRECFGHQFGGLRLSFRGLLFILSGDASLKRTNAAFKISDPISHPVIAYWQRLKGLRNQCTNGLTPTGGFRPNPCCQLFRNAAVQLNTGH